MTCQSELRQIVNDLNLSFTQKSRYLALQAEALLDYPKLPDAARSALDSGLICDLFEGHAPFKPRYVLPDYEKALQQGSEHLELPPPDDLDEAINFLLILFNHVPSVTGIPVFVGRLDKLLSPFVDETISDQQLHKKIKLMWQLIDRTLPDAFLHANIGPEDSRVARAILAVDRELKQVVPNLTLRYHLETTPDSLLQQAVENICHTNKPHIANEVLNAVEFQSETDNRGFGIASCYNALPLAGGAHTLVRLNLKKAAEMSDGSGQDFIQRILPQVSEWVYQIINVRIDYLVNESNFYQGSFLVRENLIAPERFTAMFGIYGLAEAVNHLTQLSPDKGYGHNETANALGQQIVETLSGIVQSTEVENCWNHRAMFHAQSGISIDHDTSAGCRIPYGQEPDTLQHILTAIPFHRHFTAGISDIFPIDETIRNNPGALMAICKGGMQQGLRMFTANVANGELVRVTGYMVRRSDIKKLKEEGSRLNTTVFGAEAMEKCGIEHRNARLITDETLPWALHK